MYCSKSIRVIVWLTAIGVLVFGSASTQAAIAEVISYQGLLTDDEGNAVPDGTYSITFRIYDSPAAVSADWTELHSSVAVADGLFSVLLGSTTSLEGLFEYPNRLAASSIEKLFLMRQSLNSFAVRVGVSIVMLIIVSSFFRFILNGV